MDEVLRPNKTTSEVEPFLSQSQEIPSGMIAGFHGLVDRWRSFNPKEKMVTISVFIFTLLLAASCACTGGGGTPTPSWNDIETRRAEKDKSNAAATATLSVIQTATYEAFETKRAPTLTPFGY